MLAKCSVFIATSLDGFIARPDGNIDWLTQANALVPEGEDCGYAAFMKAVDVVVMTLESSRAYDFGFVQNTYAVRRDHDHRSAG